MAATPRYELVCRLADGGMAELHLARLVDEAGRERMIVVKRLPAHAASDPRAAQALLDEARIAATLSHPNIVAVHHVEIAGGQVSIAMEFLPGRDVRALLKQLAGEAVPLAQAAAIALAVCAALHHAHERTDPDGRALRIVHRDVSPHNVVVTYDGLVKLVDFGIARAASRLAHTDLGVVKGKPGYIAPEQVRGRADRRTDIWGAARLLYEMTTGAAPFDGGGDELLRIVVEEDPIPPSARAAEYPPELEAIVLRGLARDPARRYPTAAAMGAELEAFARERALELSAAGLAALMERAFPSGARSAG